MSTIENQNRMLARKIADALLTDGDGRKADRLIMARRETDEGEIHLGGWCRENVIAEIERVLNAN